MPDLQAAVDKYQRRVARLDAAWAAHEIGWFSYNSMLDDYTAELVRAAEEAAHV